MISYLIGVVVSICDSYLIIEVLGLGYNLLAVRSDRFTIGQTYKILTYFHWNQENGPSLFGFYDQSEFDVFNLLLNCSGLGPKMALSLLNSLSPFLILKSICNSDQKTLSSANGVGPKKAEQIIVQLRQKAEKLYEKIKSLNINQDDKFDDLNTVSKVLQSLNYTRTEIEGAISYLRNNKKDKASFDELTRMALSFLSKK